MATAPRPSGPLKGGRTSSDNTVQPMLPPLGSGSELHLCESCGRGQHVLRPRPRPAISMSTREVLTIQCGHFSNFIGSHWWNLQVRRLVIMSCGVWLSLQGAEAWRETTGNKEIDYNCTFRQGLTLHVGHVILWALTHPYIFLCTERGNLLTSCHRHRLTRQVFVNIIRTASH